jgi:tetratricopeptide (TPR) repeat protein
VGVVMGVMAPTLQWLAHHTDIDRGFARVQAFIDEPPPRTAGDRGRSLDYLGIRNFRLDRYAAAAQAFGRAAEDAPSPRILHEWALAQNMSGDLSGAQRTYQRLMTKDPKNVLGWYGLAVVSTNLGDFAEARRACGELLKVAPGNPNALQLLGDLPALEAEHAKRDSLARAGRAP